MRATRVVPTLVILLLVSLDAHAQIDDFCAEFGVTPSMNSPWANIPFVFGRVTFRGADAGARFPKLTVVLIDPQQTQKRLTIERAGNYCFRRSSNSGGTIIVEVDGVEVSRRSISSFGPMHVREDFDIDGTGSNRNAAPGAISAKFSYPPNEKTADLYKKAVEAEKKKDIEQAIMHLTEIVLIDAKDFIAWAKLGTLYVEKNDLKEAEAAFRKSLELKVDYTPSWINMGRIRVTQKQYETAIEIFKHASTLEPASARIYQLLGEAYLMAKQGTLGAAALNKAIELDPVGMAECHLQLAHLYQLAGAKQMASKEYKMFLEKVPDHPEKNKFEKFIKDNPVQ